MGTKDHSSISSSKWKKENRNHRDSESCQRHRDSIWLEVQVKLFMAPFSHDQETREEGKQTRK